MQEQQNKKLAELLRKAQKGDAASLRLLCEELQRYIRGYFWQKFQDNDIVDDLTQETYVRLLSNFSTIRTQMKLRSFVTKVAIHVTQDYFRKKYREREKIQEGFEANTPATPYCESYVLEKIEPTDTSNHILSKVDLEKALMQLPEKARRILVMKAEGYKYEEISLEMGLTVSGVKMQVKRALERLRTTLLAVTFLLIDTTIIMKWLKG